MQQYQEYDVLVLASYNAAQLATVYPMPQQARPQW
jgi:hypothetical protein